MLHVVFYSNELFHIQNLTFPCSHAGGKNATVENSPK